MGEWSIDKVNIKMRNRWWWVVRLMIWKNYKRGKKK
jgi:hypothetical protein